MAQHFSLPLPHRLGEPRPFERVYFTMTSLEVLDEWRRRQPEGHMPTRLRNAVGFLMLLEAYGRDHGLAKVNRPAWRRNAERLAELGCMPARAV